MNTFNRHFGPQEAIFVTDSAEETRALGACLAGVLRAGAVIGLVGDLGAGKTTFTQGLAAGLGFQGRITSPTFVLMNEYEMNGDGAVLIHVDLYRLPEDALAQESYGMGLDDIFDLVETESRPHVAVVEWADRLEDLLPHDRLMIHFSNAGSQRTITVTAMGARSQALLNQMVAACQPKQKVTADAA